MKFYTHRNGVITKVGLALDGQEQMNCDDGDTLCLGDPPEGTPHLPPYELTYSDKRRMEYPLISELADALVKGDQAQLDAYIEACLAVKAKYPKPTPVDS